MREDTEIAGAAEPIDLTGIDGAGGVSRHVPDAEENGRMAAVYASDASNDDDEVEDEVAEGGEEPEPEAELDEVDPDSIVDEVDMDEAEADPAVEAEAAAQAAARQREEDLRLVEAILFAAPEPVGIGAFRKRLAEDTDVMALLHELTDRYQSRGVHVVKIGDKWALRTAPDLAPRLKFETQVPRKLSRAAVETMAIIAYHQPVTRAEIEEIRGVALSKGTLEGLMEQGWIKPGRRREVPGRPGTWMTTEMFLSHFGLERVEELPGMAELRAAGLLDARPVAVPLSPREREEGAGDDREMSSEDAVEALTEETLTNEMRAEEEAERAARAEAEAEAEEESPPDADEEETSAERVDHLVEGAIERK